MECQRGLGITQTESMTCACVRETGLRDCTLPDDNPTSTSGNGLNRPSLDIRRRRKLTFERPLPGVEQTTGNGYEPSMYCLRNEPREKKYSSRLSGLRPSLPPQPRVANTSWTGPPYRISSVPHTGADVLLLVQLASQKRSPSRLRRTRKARSLHIHRAP